MDVVTYALLKKYVNDTLVGMGALKGEPAQIQSIAPITGGNRVTYLWKDENGVSHTDTMDVMDGVKGEKGDKGDKGDKGTTGERGVDGEPGPAGRTATVQIGTVSSGASPSIENVGTNSDAVFNFVLPKGDKGDKGEDGEDGQDGKSFDIKGQYPNYAALIAAHPTGEAGEAYFVGADNNPDLYIWLTDDQIWLNNGKIAGVKGDKGDKGDAGFSPIASVSKSGTTTTVIIRDETGQTTAQIHDGEKGEPGEGEPVFNGTQAQWDGLTLEEKLEFLTGMVVINDDYDDSEYVKREELGTAAAKDSTDRVSPNNRGLVESQSVYSAINSALSSIYSPRGDIACAELTSALLIPANVGNVYETSDAGTTTALFLQGAGKPISAGTNVGIINAGEGRILFNLMANAFDLISYQKKDLTQAVEGETTVEGALGALSDNKQAKTLATSVESQTTVEGALGALSTNKATQAEVNDIVNVLGAKNLLPFPYESGERSIQGLTFSFDNKNGVVVSGANTSSSTAGYNFEYQRDISNFIGKTITISVENAPDNANAYCPFIIKNSSNEIVARYDIDSEHPSYTFTVPSTATKYDFQLYVRVGKSVNATFYPMIRLATDSDSTYQPYAMTNKEITDVIPSDASASNKLVTESDISYLSRDNLMYHQETGTDVLYAAATYWQLPTNKAYLVHVTASDKNSPADNYDGIIKFTYGGYSAITNIGHYKLSGTGSIDATNSFGTLQFSFVNGLPEVCIAFLG